MLSGHTAVQPYLQLPAQGRTERPEDLKAAEPEILAEIRGFVKIDFRLGVPTPRPRPKGSSVTYGNIASPVSAVGHQAVGVLSPPRLFAGPKKYGKERAFFLPGRLNLCETTAGVKSFYRCSLYWLFLSKPAVTGSLNDLIAPGCVLFDYILQKIDKKMRRLDKPGGAAVNAHRSRLTFKQNIVA